MVVVAARTEAVAVAPTNLQIVGFVGSVIIIVPVVTIELESLQSVPNEVLEYPVGVEAP